MAGESRCDNKPRVLCHRRDHRDHVGHGIDHAGPALCDGNSLKNRIGLTQILKGLIEFSEVRCGVENAAPLKRCNVSIVPLGWLFRFFQKTLTDGHMQFAPRHSSQWPEGSQQAKAVRNQIVANDVAVGDVVATIGAAAHGKARSRR